MLNLNYLIVEKSIQVKYGRNIFPLKGIAVFLISMLIPFIAYAQTYAVKGVVKNAAGEPVPGVHVVIKGTFTASATDMNGAYSINVNGQEVLVFSAVGFNPKEEAVNGQSTINVILTDNQQLLDDVVVVGYGMQKKATVTGAISSIKGEKLKSSGATNLSNAFAGRIPGVIATNRSGEPGSDWSELLIRGKGTLNNNSPLIVIDGVANRMGLERLNSNDVESITVLKDASAAIYGAQAANGVILVTTKSGTNSKPTISYNGSYTLSQNTRTPDLMNAYEFMVYDDEIKKHLGRQPLYENIKNGYLDGTIDQIKYGDTDWMKVIFRDFAPQTRHSLSVSGGSEKVKYYISGDYMYQEPQFRNTVLNFNTAQVRSNIDAQITRDLNVGLQLSGRREKRNNSIYTSKTIFWEGFNTYPFLHDYYPNGLPGPGLAWGNNLAILAAGKETGYDRVEDFFADSKVSFKLDMPWITKGLSVSGYAAFDLRFNSRKQFWDMWDTYRYNPGTGNYDKQTTNMDYNINLNQSSDNSHSTTMHFRAAYDRTFGNHSVSAFAAYEQNEYAGENFFAWRGYFLSNKIDYLDAGADKDKTNGGRGYVSARQNMFGRANYAYKDKYLAEFTLRHDGSMNFASKERWGTFPGVSLGWRLSEEGFIRNNAPFINDLKIRGSWGKLGNDRVDPFQYLSTYVMGDGAILGATPAKDKGFAPGRIGNPFITWEKVDTKNIGVEGDFWNQMLSFSAEYFHQNRKDILTPKQASIPDYTGLTLPDQNIGEVQNQGFEVMLNHRNKIGNVNYNLGGNLTFTKNKIIFFDEAANKPEWQRRTGHSIDSWLIYKTDGIYQTMEEVNSTPHLPGAKPGDIKYLDIDGNKEITSNDRVLDYSSNIPEIVYGINLGVEWKGVEVNMLWTGQANAKQMIVPYSYNLDREFYNNRWTSAEKTPNAKYPRAFNKDDKINNLWSDFWLYDASFIRLKDVQIAYNLPKEWMQKIGANSVRLYVIGSNLFTLDKIKFQDPESNATSAGQYYPQQRSFTFGLNVSF